MKTLIIFIVNYGPKLFLLEGDFTVFNNIYINSGESRNLEDKLVELMYDNEGYLKYKPLETPLKLEESTIVIHCGFIP